MICEVLLFPVIKQKSFKSESVKTVFDLSYFKYGYRFVARRILCSKNI